MIKNLDKIQKEIADNLMTVASKLLDEGRLDEAKAVFRVGYAFRRVDAISAEAIIKIIGEYEAMMMSKSKSYTP